MARQSCRDWRLSLSGLSTPAGSCPHALADRRACSAAMLHSCSWRRFSAGEAELPWSSVASRTSPNPPDRIDAGFGTPPVVAPLGTGRVTPADPASLHPVFVVDP